jgi:ElaB/YqjD/DUF883 family membrane-anchored ribosome-binding protein
MVEALAAKDDRPAAASQASLGDNLERLGQGLKDSWDGATAAVTETGRNVQQAVGTTVEAVEGAVEGMAENLGAAVRGTVGALGRALDFPGHVRRHPWLMLGASVVLGVLLGRLLDRRR